MSTKKNLSHNLIDIDNIYANINNGIQNILEQINENNGLEIDLTEFKYSFEFNNRRHFITIDTNDYIIEMAIYNDSFISFSIAQKIANKKFKIVQAIECSLFKFDSFNTYIELFTELLMFVYSNMNSLIPKWCDKDVIPSGNKNMELSNDYFGNNYEKDFTKTLSIHLLEEYHLTYKNFNAITIDLGFINFKNKDDNCRLLGDKDMIFNK
jgi:hypothetical protein